MTSTLLNNRYRILKNLGSGGFGETILAEDTQMPSLRRCVIKQLKPVINNPQMYQLIQDRFKREAAILEELGGGNNQIPKLYGYFSEKDLFYLVQEWIPGETLSQKLQLQGQLSESSVKEILINILPVLDYVHSKGIIHRDIKPDNIIVRQKDGLPVLIDFGAVRETMGTVMTTGGTPTSSIVIGTPGFMPSEQSAGRPIFSSDLYSLGLTAIYLLTGKLPQELATDYQSGEIVWYQQGSKVSQSLTAVLNQAIKYHPRDRYPNAIAMLNALRGSTTQVSFAPTIINPPIPPEYPNQDKNQGQNSSQSTLIMGSIIGGMIGVSIVVGFAITRPKSEEPKVKPSLTTSASAQPTTTPTSTPTKPSQPEYRQSSQEAIASYYTNINNRNYAAAWDQFAPQLQTNRSEHPKGYNSFLEWWQLVYHVDILGFEQIETGSQTSIVNTRFKYNLRSRKVIYQTLRFSLVWNEASGRWLIYRIQRIAKS